MSFSAQLALRVLQHCDQSGAHFFRRADRLGERQTDGSWSSGVIADISKPYLSTPVMLAEVMAVALERALQ